MKFRKRLEPTLPQGSRIPVDRGFWDRPDFGGHVHAALEIAGERVEDQ